MKCNNGFEIEVLKSGAGYYIGTFDYGTEEAPWEAGPMCRLSGYYNSREEAEKALEERSFYRDAPENMFCSRGRGCY